MGRNYTMHLNIKSLSRDFIPLGPDEKLESLSEIRSTANIDILVKLLNYPISHDIVANFGAKIQSLAFNKNVARFPHNIFSLRLFIKKASYFITSCITYCNFVFLREI